MGLFGSSRDISFIKKINTELLDNIIQQEVDYYKYYLSETQGNAAATLYGEASSQKTYYSAVRLTCILERGDQTYAADDQFGIDVGQSMTFRFFKPKLVEIGLVPAAGDIVEVRGSFYEIDQINENQFVVGRDGNYGKSVGAEFGESLSIVCVAHYTRTTRLQITNARV